MTQVTLNSELPRKSRSFHSLLSYYPTQTPLSNRRSRSGGLRPVNDGSLRDPSYIRKRPYSLNNRDREAIAITKQGIASRSLASIVLPTRLAGYKQYSTHFTIPTSTLLVLVITANANEPILFERPNLRFTPLVLLLLSGPSGSLTYGCARSTCAAHSELSYIFIFHR